MCQRGDEAVGHERDQRHDRDRLARDPPDLLELRRLGAGELGRSRHEVVEVPVPVPDGPPGIPVEDGGLHERKDVREGVLPDHVGRGGDRAVGADDERRRHQYLREIGHHRPVGGRHARAPEVSDGGGPVRPDHDPFTIELAVGDPQIVQHAHRPPDGAHELVIDLGGVDRTQRASADLAHQQRVACGGHPRRHDGEDRHPRAFGQQGDERLVLDLAQPADPEARSLAPVPER